ncbi:putative dehydrogenase [Abditibacterium utsteinense]|uniref:Putative dehydrogenase n=1 Tax=Abditibacterium utsteinense TaxID=1960156 RepID=A0A2S8SP74_9BACT|nr:Gfo/Idh/MocA family oxidoreductase [Abditibacterium utsteinense]PQV62602.1 putative dehydrogenase [Abditibacterium utsteinense]
MTTNTLSKTAHLNGAPVASVPNVALIGLGAIASGYGSPDDAAPYCHVGGLLHSGRVRLHSVADMSVAAREAFTSKWGEGVPRVQIFDSSTALLESATADEPLDIIGVCVRGPYHFDVMREVLEAAPRVGTRAIFLEKPPTSSLAEMDELAALANEKGVNLTVSYSRHWAPHVLRLEELVRDGLIGEVHSVVGYCGQLVLSYASHTTDLIRQFALAQSPGHAVAVSARTHFQSSETEIAMPAGFEAEPHLDHLFIEFSNGVLGTQIGADGEGGSFYVDVFGTKGRVRAGIYAAPQAWDAKGNPLELGEMPPNASVFQVVYEQIAGFLDGGPMADCTDADWHEVNEIGFVAIESASNGGFKRIELPNINRARKIWANG